LQQKDGFHNDFVKSKAPAPFISSLSPVDFPDDFQAKVLPGVLFHKSSALRSSFFAGDLVLTIRGAKRSRPTFFSLMHSLITAGSRRVVDGEVAVDPRPSPVAAQNPHAAE
jgi:hypothetical protein